MDYRSQPICARYARDFPALGKPILLVRQVRACLAMMHLWEGDWDCGMLREHIIGTISPRSFCGVRISQDLISRLFQPV